MMMTDVCIDIVFIITIKYPTGKTNQQGRVFKD